MRSRKVLLIGWDAAEWKIIRPLMDAGKMPNLRRLVENGASGDIATLHPALSPMLWTSICTGKRPFRHGIHGFTEPAPDGSGIRPVTNLSRTAKAVWNILNQNALRSIVLGWWPSHPVEPIDGVMVSDHYHRAHGPLEDGWTLAAHTIHPVRLAEPLAAVRVHPETLAPELVERFIPLAREIDQDRDQRLGGFLRTLAEAMSIQSAALWLLQNEPWNFFAVYYESIDHFSHGFMRYHPPRQSWIGERDFELYHNVISTVYEFHDEMLGDLLRHTGEGTSVILMSDHGFHPDHLRPASIPNVPAGPAIEHRDFGVLVLNGSEIRKHEALYGASVLDVAPTILSMFGLPVGEDMDGKVLSQAFVNPPPAESIPSWEDVPGPDGRHPPHTRLDPVAAHEALEQMIALGYVERPDENREVAIRNTVRELRYNLAQAYQDAGRHLEAHAILLELWESSPGEERFAVRLFASCQALRKHEQMRRIVEDLDSRREAPGHQPPVADYLKAQLFVAEKRYVDALALLEQVAGHLVRPGVFVETADLCLRLRRPDDAQRVYRKALAIDPDTATAYLGLGRLALRREEFEAAARLALDALQRSPHDPLAHLLLGRAMVGMRDDERAAEAFRAAISCNPNFPQAHLRLAALLERLGDTESASRHRRLARTMRRAPVALTASAENTLLAPPDSTAAPRDGLTEMPAVSDSLVIVTGLPRSGTSLLMQMLAAGGMPVLSDGSRQADDDNPHGYFEYEPVKNLRRDWGWLFETKGKAVKIVAPLLSALPPGLPCRVILCERDLDEVLDSQERMLQHRNQPVTVSADRRRRLKDEYRRTLMQVKAMLSARPQTQLLVIAHSRAISDPRSTAEDVSRFLCCGLDVNRMAAVVEPRLHRNRVVV